MSHSCVLINSQNNMDPIIVQAIPKSEPKIDNAFHVGDFIIVNVCSNLKHNISNKLKQITIPPKIPQTAK